MKIKTSNVEVRTDIVTTFGTFHKSINKPIPTLNLTIVLVSLSKTQSNTINDVKQPNKTEFADKPSNDLRFFQN